MTYEDIRNELREFVAERNWEQYHNLKDLALSVSIEASELVEIFQWRNPEDINDEDRQNIKLELADVLIYIFFMYYIFSSFCRQVLNYTIIFVKSFKLFSSFNILFLFLFAFKLSFATVISNFILLVWFVSLAPGS